MTLEDLMSEILSDDCPRECLPDGSWVFSLDLHCVTYTITAKREAVPGMGGVWKILGCVKEQN